MNSAGSISFSILVQYDESPTIGQGGRVALSWGAGQAESLTSPPDPQMANLQGSG